jgi:hypothetical protein
MPGQPAVFSFDAPLRSLLRADRRQLVELPVDINAFPSIKHLVEALGVPHTEVGAVRLNGALSTLDALARPADRVELAGVAPGQGAFAGPGEPRFLADLHLGRLAAYLRMLGFDTLYPEPCPDEELARLSGAEQRVLLSRDRRLLMHRAVVHGCCLRSLEPISQLGEVVHRYGLARFFQPFRRCLRCNQLLRAAPKAEVLDRLEPLTRLYFDEFALCTGCGQVYWKGSHYERMLSIIQGI